MGAATDLFDVAKEWLLVCAEAVATGPGGPIDRAFVSPGPPALDCCPQLTVHVGGPQEADTAPLSPPLAPGHRATVTGAVHLVNLTATVVRCLPTIDGTELPSMVALESAAAEIDADVWAIWNYTRRRFQQKVLFASESGQRELFIEPAFPLDPAGACGGWQIPLRVQLSGYPVA